MNFRCLPAVFAAAFVLAPCLAQAQPDSRAETVDVNTFHPTPGATNFFSTESGNVNSHLGFSGGLNLNFANSPLSVRVVGADGSDGQDIGAVVPWRFDAVFLAAIGIFDFAEIGVAMPLVLQGAPDAGAFESANLGQLFPSELASFAPGDVRLVPKVRFLDLDDDILSAALVGTVILPTGSGEFAQENNLVIAPSLALSSNFKPVRFGVNLGYRMRDRTKFADALIVDDEYFAKAAVALDMSGTGEFEIIGEVFGHTPVENPFARNSDGLGKEIQKARTGLEGDVGIRWITGGNTIVTAGVGGGLLPGYGAPAPRVFVSAMYYTGEFGIVDTDKDGVPDSTDECINEPEDIDGFEDSDGCPDEDNDQDGVLDEDDQCPDDAEDIDGFKDEDGCPEVDNDEDGILDGDDQCPNDAEDIDGFEDDDGCPDLDNDNDSIPDSKDKCPDQKEDMDGYLDFDGCPDEDNDGDGLPDLNDLCPNFAEDMDGVADDDGCPEDNDGDGIPDEEDKCPNEAETYNGIDDEDGCPEKLKVKSLVEVTQEKIVIKEKVYFRSGSARVLNKSNNLLDQVAAVLKNYKHLKKVEIQGHTDNRGPNRGNKRLSQKRADAVRSYLQKKGIAGERLVAVGYGEEKPIASNGTRRGREANRRVEFVILEQTPVGKDVAADQPAPPPVEVPEEGEFEIELDMGGDEAPADGEKGAGDAEIEIEVGGDEPAKKSTDDKKDEEPEIEFEF